MEILKTIFDHFMHLDKYLSGVIQCYGNWTYLLLFIIIFCETGLVVTPFLPGDSLLFAAGSFAALKALNVWWLFILLSLAAFLGDTVNYWIGYLVGPKIFQKENVRFLNKKYLVKAHQFYEKYGAKTIIIARFVPIIRTFAPFVAGIGTMSYLKFITYNIIGGLAWIAACVFSGFWFGKLPFVKEHFSLVILAIIFISLIPGILEFVCHKIGKAREKAEVKEIKGSQEAEIAG